MTLQEEAELSAWAEIGFVSNHTNVRLVQHRESRKLYVKKTQDIYDREVYRFLEGRRELCFPRIEACIQDGSRLLVIEEYIAGDNLKTYLEDRGKLSEQETCGLVLQICDMLIFLHGQEKPIIHRDLKPSNFILTREGRLVLVDFNAARYYEKGRTGDQDTEILGTRGYAAPEQYGFAQTDARSDIYALGRMMRELLAGEGAGDAAETGTLWEIAAACAAFDPEKRYQTAEEVKGALLAWKNGEMAPAGPARGPAAGGTGFRSWLPPGFRSGSPWKALAAVCGYFLLFYNVWTMDFIYEEKRAAGLSLFLFRAATTAIGLLWVGFFFDYRGLRSALPLMKRRGWRWLFGVGYLALLTFAALLLLSVLLVVCGD